MRETNEYSQANIDKLLKEAKAMQDSVRNSKTFVSRRCCAGSYVAGYNGRVFEITKSLLDFGEWWIVSEIGTRNCSDPIPTYREAREEARMWAEDE